MPKPPQTSPWWDAAKHADRRPFLLARGRIQRAIRRWFEQQDFVEVDTAALQVSPGNETHLHGFATELIGPDGARRPLYLHTSPEFACKKLLAAGEKRIFTFAPAFRNRERGPLHHPQFTMLEWYRAGEPYETLMEDSCRMLSIAAEAAGASNLEYSGRIISPYEEPEYITVGEAFQRFASIDLLGTIDTTSGTDRESLLRQADAAGVRCAADDTWGDIFSRVLVERVQPRLAEWRRPCLLLQYPVSEAALAMATSRDPRVAERFELYVCGVELTNGFYELTDPAAQRSRFEAEMAEKERIYGERYPIDEDFLAALAHMPPASGAALGFDRLVMLATGASHIEQVLWTPLPESGPRQS